MTAVVERHEARVGDVVEDRDRCRRALFSLRAMSRWPANCSRWATTIEKVSSQVTPCWREMDSNLQYAGTVHPVRRTGGGSGSLRRTRCRLGGSASF